MVTWHVTVESFWDQSWESSENLSTFRTFLGICFSKVSIHRYPGVHFNFLSIYIYISLQLFAHGKGSEVLTLICAIRSTQKFAANTPELFLHMPITSSFRRLCQTSAGSKSRCVQQSFVYNGQDAWIKESRWVKCLVLRSLVARRIDHIHLSPKEWSASAKLGISGRLRVPSFAKNISNILLLEVIGTAIPTACQVAYETELNAMHIAAGLGSCEAMEALTHGTNDEELPSYLAYLAIWHTHFCPCCVSFLVLP